MDDRRRKEAGVAGESIALEFLQSQGLDLIERNYSCRGGEIDLVMLQERTLVLVEVRFRSSTDYGGGAASVTWHKQRRLIAAARHLMLTRADLRRYPARFDVIAVSPGANGPQVNWIRNAFTL